MACHPYREWLSASLDQQLESSHRVELEQHLAGCAGCRDELAGLQRVVSALHAATPPGGPNLLPGVRRKLDHQPWWQKVAHRVESLWPVQVSLQTMALAATAVLVAMVVVMPKPSVPRSRANVPTPVAVVPSTPPQQRLSNPPPTVSTERDTDDKNREHVVSKGSLIAEDRFDRLDQPAEPARTPAEALILELPQATGLQERSLELAATPTATRALGKEELKTLHGLTGEANFATTDGMARSTDDTRLSDLTQPPALPAMAYGGIAQGSSTQSPAFALTAAKNRTADLFQARSPGTDRRQTTTGAAPSADRTAPAQAGASIGISSAMRSVMPSMYLRWHVANSAKATTELAHWVQGRGGELTPLDNQHVAIALPAADVSLFLHSFSGAYEIPPPASPPSLPQSKSAEKANQASPNQAILVIDLSP